MNPCGRKLLLPPATIIMELIELGEESLWNYSRIHFNLVTSTFGRSQPNSVVVRCRRRTPASGSSSSVSDWRHRGDESGISSAASEPTTRKHARSLYWTLCHPQRLVLRAASEFTLIRRDMSIACVCVLPTSSVTKIIKNDTTHNVTGDFRSARSRAHRAPSRIILYLRARWSSGGAMDPGVMFVCIVWAYVICERATWTRGPQIARRGHQLDGDESEAWTARVVWVVAIILVLFRGWARIWRSIMLCFTVLFWVFTMIIPTILVQ